MWLYKKLKQSIKLSSRSTFLVVKLRTQVRMLKLLFPNKKKQKILNNPPKIKTTPKYRHKHK